MAANINDKITKVSSGVRPVSTTVSTIRNSGATTLACADLTGWTTTEVVFFVTYSVDGQGNVVVGSQSDWKGIVSGTNINNLTLTGGADNGNSPGDIVELLPTAAYAKSLAENILTHADQDGTLAAGAVDNAAVLASNVVTTAKIADNAVTASKIDFTTFPNGGKLMIQTKTVSYSGTYDVAGSIFFKDIGSAGSWTTPFTSLISVFYSVNDVQLWPSGDSVSTTSAGNVRVWKSSSTSRAVTVTVVGLGLVA